MLALLFVAPVVVLLLLVVLLEVLPVVLLVLLFVVLLAVLLIVVDGAAVVGWVPQAVHNKVAPATAGMRMCLNTLSAPLQGHHMYDLHLRHFY